MSSIRNALVSVLIASAVATGTALAPTPSAAQSTKTTADDVSKWTQKQWNAAKAKWAKEKDKWTACNKQAADQKLTGRKSWSFIYDCMSG